VTAALALFVGALAAAWLFPAVLRRADLGRRDPAALLAGWLAAMATVVLTATAGVVLLLLPEHGPVGSLLHATHDCLAAVRHGSPPEVEERSGALGAVILLAVTVRVGLVYWRGAQRRDRTRAAHLGVLRPVTRPDPAAPDTLWLEHERPVAFSLTGRRGVIVVTDGLNRHLSDDGVAAVLAHERAHLSGRHHLVLAIADALRAALPFLPLFRQAPLAVRDLVELAADGAAARRFGARAVREALVTLSNHPTVPAALDMDREAVELRLARLSNSTACPGTVRRSLSCATVTVATVAAPFLVATGLLLGLALLSCLTTWK
jgi:Zn-dependent protease with chaperone function